MKLELYTRIEKIMRTIKCFGKEFTADEFIKREICKNAGMESVVYKEELVYLCETRGISYKQKMTKEELFDLLIENGSEYKELAETFCVGVGSQVYQTAFGISHQDVKYLEKKGILKKAGEYRFRAFGEYCYAPLYSINQYICISEAEIHSILEERNKKNSNRN